MRYDGVLHRKLPAEGARIITRNPLQPQTSDKEEQAEDAVTLGLIHLREALEVVGRLIENRADLVDEYVPGGTGVATTAQLTVPPDYEFAPEKIESIIIVGPAGAITLTLGDRSWPLTIPASGILVIAPVAILLSRTDIRQVSAAAPGNYSLELMGIADKRFQA